MDAICLASQAVVDLDGGMSHIVLWGTFLLMEEVPADRLKRCSEMASGAVKKAMCWCCLDPRACFLSLYDKLFCICVVSLSTSQAIKKP